MMVVSSNTETKATSSRTTTKKKTTKNQQSHDANRPINPNEYNDTTADEQENTQPKQRRKRRTLAEIQSEKLISESKSTINKNQKNKDIQSNKRQHPTPAQSELSNEEDNTSEIDNNKTAMPPPPKRKTHLSTTEPSSSDVNPVVTGMSLNQSDTTNSEKTPQNIHNELKVKQTPKETNTNNQTDNEDQDGFITVTTRRYKSHNESRIYRKNLITKTKTYFKGEGLEDYKDNEKAIIKELNRCKPGIFIVSAKITLDNILLIITDDERSTMKIRDGNWPNNAFLDGISQSNRTDLMYVAIKGVKRDIIITERERTKLEENYGITNPIRVKGRDGRPTHTIKAKINNVEDFSKLKEEGILIYYFRNKVEAWNNKTIRCKNCSSLEHYEKQCNNPRTCPRCSTNHQTGSCKATKSEYKCSQCHGAHASYDKKCQY